jgi:hypothetical protein
MMRYKDSFLVAMEVTRTVTAGLSIGFALGWLLRGRTPSTQSRARARFQTLYKEKLEAVFGSHIRLAMVHRLSVTSEPDPGVLLQLQGFCIPFRRNSMVILSATSPAEGLYLLEMRQLEGDTKLDHLLDEAQLTWFVLKFCEFSVFRFQIEESLSAAGFAYGRDDREFSQGFRYRSNVRCQVLLTCSADFKIIRVVVGFFNVIEARMIELVLSITARFGREADQIDSDIQVSKEEYRPGPGSSQADVAQSFKALSGMPQGNLVELTQLLDRLISSLFSTIGECTPSAQTTID